METILEACKVDDAARLKELLRYRHVDQQYDQGRTALHFAAAYGSIRCVDFLRKQGCFLDMVDAGMVTPLQLACRFGAFLVARVLVKGGASVNCQDVDGRSPLHWALLSTETSMMETIAILLKDSSHVNFDIIDRSGRSALMLALELKHETIARMFIKRGISFGTSISHIFAPLRSLKTTSGSSLDLRYPFGSILHFAVFKSSLECLKMLVAVQPRLILRSDEDGLTALHVAATEGYTEVLCALLEGISNPNDNALSSTDGRTCLHMAAIGGHSTLIAALVTRNFAIDASDNQGNSYVVTSHSTTFSNLSFDQI